MNGAVSTEAMERDADHRLCAAQGHHPGTEGHGFCVLELRIWRHYLRSLSREELLRSEPPAPSVRPR